MSKTQTATRGQHSPPDYKRILVGYDGSKNSERALARAIALAKEQGAALRILVAVSTVLPVFSPISQSLPESTFEEIIQDGKDALADAVASAKLMLDDVSGVLKDGHAADELVRYATENDIDLIVLGRRGVSAIERFLLGGVSSSVIGHSKCDVLVVK
jgi:nucleotide-binding universal stress UspA family protein